MFHSRRAAVLRNIAITMNRALTSMNGVFHKMKYLHTMIRASDPDATIAFFELLGLKELKRFESEAGRFTLIFLAAPGDEDAQVELTHNWDESGYDGGRNFGHLAYAVENIYESCQRLIDGGVTINRPPRDGHMAFVRSPDNISIELLQAGDRLVPAEPWASMTNVGVW
jgi:lactoylglutathione lyase